MLFKRRRRPQTASAVPEPCTEPLDPALYGKLVDGDLPAGWLEFHRAFLNSRDELLLILESETACAPDESSARALHEQYVAEFEAYRAECDRRGECFVKYFADTHSGSDLPHREWLSVHPAD